MECISVFDMLKIGVGPSSSHTLGPWRAAERWIKELKDAQLFDSVEKVSVDLYGSLSLTGKGHATDLAVILGLLGKDPETIPTEEIPQFIETINTTHQLEFNSEKPLPFNPKTEIVFNKKFLPFHANALTFTAHTTTDTIHSTFYSIGGGFVVKEALKNAQKNFDIKCSFPYPIEKGTELVNFCNTLEKSISQVVLENEKSIRTETEIDSELKRICLLYTSPSPRDKRQSRMPSSA